jgi:hypothetical protein
MKNTPTSMAENELISLTKEEENGISNLEIIALVGNPSTGKSTSLIQFIKLHQIFVNAGIEENKKIKG